MRFDFFDQAFAAGKELLFVVVQEPAASDKRLACHKYGVDHAAVAGIEKIGQKSSAVGNKQALGVDKGEVCKAACEKLLKRHPDITAFFCFNVGI